MCASLTMSMTMPPGVSVCPPIVWRAPRMLTVRPAARASASTRCTSARLRTQYTASTSV